MLLMTKIGGWLLLYLFKIITVTFQNHKHTPVCVIYYFYAFAILLNISYKSDLPQTT